MSEEYLDNISAFIQALTKGPESDVVFIIGLYGEGQNLEARVEEVCQAIRGCKRPHPSSQSGVRIHFSDQVMSEDTLSKLLDAIAKNTIFTQWNFDYCGLEPRHVPIFIQKLNNAGHVQYLQATGNDFDAASTISLAAAFLERPKCEGFDVSGPREDQFTEEVIESLAKLRRKFPGVNLCMTPPARVIDAKVAMAAIENPEPQRRIQEASCRILAAYTVGNLQLVMDEYTRSKQEVAVAEETRLLGLLPRLNEKYNVIGGMEMLNTLPADFDSYQGAGARGQFLPKPLRAVGAETQISYLLGAARYKQKLLKTIGEEVIAAVERLQLGTDAVNPLFEEFGLDGVCCELLAYEVKVDSEESRYALDVVVGRYEQTGFVNNLPCFERTSGSGCEVDNKLSHTNSSWRFTNEFGSDTGDVWLSDGPSTRRLPEVNDEESPSWVHVHGGAARSDVKPTLVRDFCSKKLTQSVFEFLLERDSIKGLLSIADNKLVELKLGPPKGLARAMQKGAEWLLDLNRCTFYFDSPAILALGYHLFVHFVKKRGGEISRLSNYIMKDGCPSTDLKQPPCVHANAKIDGWTFEVMFMLESFAHVKECIHKYYEVSRSKAPTDLLQPIFPELQEDPTLMPQNGATGNGLQAIRALKS